MCNTPTMTKNTQNYLSYCLNGVDRGKEKEDCVETRSDGMFTYDPFLFHFVDMPQNEVT